MDKFPPDWLPYDLNRKIKVSLTEQGREVYRKHYAGVSAFLGGGIAMPEADEDGFTEMETWEFMLIFGPHLRRFRRDTLMHCMMIERTE